MRITHSIASARFGPVEWLWRGVPYGSLQPLRTAEAATRRVYNHPSMTDDLAADGRCVLMVKAAATDQAGVSAAQIILVHWHHERLARVPVP